MGPLAVQKSLLRAWPAGVALAEPAGAVEDDQVQFAALGDSRRACTGHSN